MVRAICLKGQQEVGVLLRSGGGEEGRLVLEPRGTQRLAREPLVTPHPIPPRDTDVAHPETIARVMLS